MIALLERLLAKDWSPLFKYAYSIGVLGVTVWWGWFSVTKVVECMSLPTSTNILEVAGANILMGALIVWNGNINQHWFRKKVGE